MLREAILWYWHRGVQIDKLDWTGEVELADETVELEDDDEEEDANIIIVNYWMNVNECVDSKQTG